MRNKYCKYKGFLFRSILEMNWARTFDLLSIKWEYEPKSFNVNVLGKISKYYPDFLLPEMNIYMEVKGTHRFSGLSMLKPRYLATKSNLLVLKGMKDGYFKFLNDIELNQRNLLLICTKCKKNILLIPKQLTVGVVKPKEKLCMKIAFLKSLRN